SHAGLGGPATSARISNAAKRAKAPPRMGSNEAKRSRSERERFMEWWRRSIWWGWYAVGREGATWCDLQECRSREGSGPVDGPRRRGEPVGRQSRSPGWEP